MRKILIAVTLMLLLLAANAQAATTYSVDLVGFADNGIEYDKYISASVTVTLDGSTLSFLVKNTSDPTVHAQLTSLLFAFPDNYSVTLDDSSITSATGWYYGTRDELKGLNEGAGVTGLIDEVDAALVAKSNLNIMGAGSATLGIAVGAQEEFVFTVLSDDLSALTASMFAPLIARFQSVDLPTITGGSCVATSTPIPGAAWLLGSGLLGLVGLRRFRA